MAASSGNSPGAGSSTASPWSVGSHTGNGHDSLSLPPIVVDDDYELLRAPIQYFNSGPRAPSPDEPSLFLPEPSNSRNRLPPLNQQTRGLPPPRAEQPWYTLYSDSPDPFDEFLNLTPGPPRREQQSSQVSPSRSRQTSRNRTRESSIVDLTDSPPLMPMAPTTRKRKAEEDAAVGEQQRIPKAPRLGQGQRRPKSKPASKAASKPEVEEAEVVDLVDLDDDTKYEDFANKRQEELIKQQNKDESSRPVKLAEFQCIVCMDNPTDLTVTHCGHLFCSECLHQALYAGIGKKNCPVCRSSISVVAPRGRKPGKNGMFALEMKLMTSKRKGKQPAR